MSFVAVLFSDAWRGTMVIGLAIPVTRYDQTTVEVDINPCDLPPSAGGPSSCWPWVRTRVCRIHRGRRAAERGGGGLSRLEGGHVADPLSPTSATVRL